MKILKNHGDYYIAKAQIKRSPQSRILYALLACVVVFTIVFLGLLNQRYSSMAAFFGEGEVTLTQQQEVMEENLPSIAGKTNFLIIETNDAATELHYLCLLQADKDNLAYKTAFLSPDMKIKKTTLRAIFRQGGGAALQTQLMEYFGFEIHYYAQFEVSSFVEFSTKLGKFVYFSPQEIHFSGGGKDDKYTLKMHEGEQRIDGKELSNLLRYYAAEKQDYAAANELLLRALTMLFNEENEKNAESLFRLFVKSATTDITVRDFEKGKNALRVFAKRNTDITLYGETAIYEAGALSQQSMKTLQGYFN